jgi:hypothetical protein
MGSRETHLTVGLVAALALIDAIWIIAGGFSFELSSLTSAICATVAMAAIGYVYARLRPNARLAAMGTETAFLISFSAAAALFSYLMASLDRPLIDGALMRADAWMGFDWMAYVGFVNVHPWLGTLSSAVYQSCLFQVALAFILLPSIGRTDRVRELTWLVMISGIVCITISGLLPALGAMAYLHPSPAFLAQNHPVVDLAYKAPLYALRDGALTHLSLTNVHGLVAFPSYHVALCVILVIAFRGVKGWFWPVAGLNALVILSTPIDGGHHMIDGVGGAALALGVAAVVITLRKRLGVSNRPETSEPGDAPALAAQHA